MCLKCIQVTMKKSANDTGDLAPPCLSRIAGYRRIDD